MEEGALFDTETGYQGIIFPFKLYFETKESYFNPFLWTIFDHWQNEKVFLGGGAVTGRFVLEQIKFYQWNIERLNKGSTGTGVVK